MRFRPLRAFCGLTADASAFGCSDMGFENKVSGW
jgi:hypothetical protein